MAVACNFTKMSPFCAICKNEPFIASDFKRNYKCVYFSYLSNCKKKVKLKFCVKLYILSIMQYAIYFFLKTKPCSNFAFRISKFLIISEGR